MRHHHELFEAVRKHTGMYVSPPTFQSVTSLVVGYDLAYEDGVLAGFREWLQLNGARGANLSWPILVLRLAFPGFDSPVDELKTEEAHRHAIETLFDLLAEFDQVRSKHDGLREIFLAYDRRMHSRDPSD